MSKVKVNDVEIQIIRIEEEDYISLTDMVRNIDNGIVLIEKWLRNKNTIEFLGIWEELYNEQFDFDEYCNIMQEAGLNRFAMSVRQWVERTNAKGIIAKAGRYGGTYAYKDIAFEFASWVSPKFKLYLIKEFERLKKEEQSKIGWNAKRELAKINYKIHTDAIKDNLVPKQVTKQQTAIVYASDAKEAGEPKPKPEADVLNVALFGMTAKEWRVRNMDKKGNIRDYATVNELICLSNLESLNAILIEDGLPQKERLIKLNEIAIHQMAILEEQENHLYLK